MGIKLSILSHQTECLERVCKVFEKIDIEVTDDLFANPVFEPDDIKIKSNIGTITSALMSAWKLVQVRLIATQGLCMSLIKDMDFINSLFWCRQHQSRKGQNHLSKPIMQKPILQTFTRIRE